MTRKDYETIAAAIRRSRAKDREGIVRVIAGNMLDDLAEDLAGELAADNPRFDTARFLKACGCEA
ncbi:hypothetical protein V6R85_02545 [Agrobacterium sp. CCNWLW32]|uniref:hypothetical protein n=1 Tax=Agrobacterium sp. CCNWLW32 TaxID=3122072 RepID=UPI0004590A89|nr:hypothetical protein AWN88_11280 [Agrobacterium tumefaciens]KAJ36257.1 hypothetical protein BW45_23090 [Agrobacterium tumefaciens]